MGVMTYLRERMGKIVAIVIGLSLFAFIVGEVLRQGSSFFKGDQNVVGEVSGDKIPYDEYSKKMDQSIEQFKQQSGQANLNSQFTSYIQENTWNQTVNELILNKEMDKLGLEVSEDEAQAMVSGNKPNPQVVQAFTNQQTGQFDKNALNNFLIGLKTAKADDPQKVRWNAFITQMISGAR